MRPYLTSILKENEISDQIQSLFAAGLIKESNSNHSSLVTFVMKRDEDKKIKLCVNYHKLNLIMKMTLNLYNVLVF